MSSKVCKHCGEPIPAHLGDDSFCCNGCAHAYALLKEMNLSSYYEKRVINSQVRPLIPEDAPQIDYSPYTEINKDAEQTLHFMVDGLHCAACVWVIEHILERQQGVTYARLNMTTRRLTVSWHKKQTTPEAFIKAVFELGYRLMPYNPDELKRQDSIEERNLLICMAVAGFAAMNVMLFSISIWSGGDMGHATRTLLHWLSAMVALPAIAYAGRPFFSAALKALKKRNLTMEVPISLAILLAAALSIYQTIQGAEHAYYDSAIMLLFFLLIGRYLDKRMQTRALNSAENLLTLQASFATIKSADGNSKRIPIKALKVGDILLVSKGEHIAADGVVISGISTTDNSMITGESLPQQVSQNTEVVGGCLNLEGILEVKVTAVGNKTVLAELARLVEGSIQAKNKYINIADKASRIYAPAVHIFALGTFLFWFMHPATSVETAVIYAISVLIVTCPCAIALAVPSAQVAASSALLKQGVILKSGTALERLQSIDTVVFDKTGTLTEGNFKLVSKADDENLRIAASLAVCSSHPLARSLVQAVNPQTKAAPNVREIAGQGLQTTILGHTVKLGSRAFCGNTSAQQNNCSELWLKMGDKPPVCFLFEDTLRHDAKQTVAQFQTMGMNVILLSGDNKTTVENVAHQLNIESSFATQSPQNKQEFIAHLQQNGHKVLMVGDGLNDTPAIATADVSMTLACAADITRVHADIILQNNHLLAAPTTTKFAQRVQHIIKLNFGLSIAYNSIAIPIAMAGYITPLLAAVFMSTSSLTVMLNSLRLAKTKQEN